MRKMNLSRDESKILDLKIWVFICLFVSFLLENGGGEKGNKNIMLSP